MPYPNPNIDPAPLLNPSPDSSSPTVFVTMTITTEDQAPTAAPNRISDKPGFDHADVVFQVIHDGTLRPGPSLLPAQSSIVPPAQLRPGAGTYPGDHAYRRPGSQYPPIYPDVSLVPDRAAAIPSPGANAPLLPTPTATLPSISNTLPGLDIPSPSRDVVGYVLRENGSDSYTGKGADFKGVRCGSLPCSTRRAASAIDYRLHEATNDAFSATYADANDGIGDGTRNMALWVAIEGQGTS
jgi:hypothetical protein